MSRGERVGMILGLVLIVGAVVAVIAVLVFGA
jgi:hypothetical protein